MINAFLLAWFTHLITKILSDLTFKLFGPDALLELFEPKTEEKIEVVNELDQNGSKKAKKGHLRRRRRKEDSENDSENDSEYDEDDSDSLEIGAESDSDFDDDDSELIDSDYNNSNDDDSIVIEEESNIISNLHMMRSLQNHPMLESFRLCCLWFMSSKDIIEELVVLLEDSEELTRRLSWQVLFNITVGNPQVAEKVVDKTKPLIAKKLEEEVPKTQNVICALVKQNLQEYSCDLPTFKLILSIVKAGDFALLLAIELSKNHNLVEPFTVIQYWILENLIFDTLNVLQLLFSQIRVHSVIYTAENVLTPEVTETG